MASKCDLCEPKFFSVRMTCTYEVSSCNLSALSDEALHSVYSALTWGFLFCLPLSLYDVNHRACYLLIKNLLLYLLALGQEESEGSS